ATIAGLEAQLAAEQQARAEARRHHAARETEWSAYAAEMQSRLATYRSQRAWRVMLAARRAYTVATRRGWLHLLPWAFQALRGKGSIESEQLMFPLPPDEDNRRA
ncbi:MAG: hypothetical protein JNK87_12220, partial [Bryobacterales bacterium]|nr:hypothetical protein [Bryobacterales bacterium]